MRMLGLVLVFVGCQRVDPAEHSAATRAPAAESRSVAVPTAVPTTMTMGTAPKQSCGCAGGTGESCGASCGGSCGGGDAPTWGALPEGTTWQPLHVTGMHCGGCARKIERALAKVDGVLGVKIDVHAQRVEIAVSGGLDARTVAKPAIDGLGYHVD